MKRRGFRMLSLKNIFLLFTYHCICVCLLDESCIRFNFNFFYLIMFFIRFNDHFALIQFNSNPSNGCLNSIIYIIVEFSAGLTRNGVISANAKHLLQIYFCIFRQKKCEKYFTNSPAPDKARPS